MSTEVEDLPVWVCLMCTFVYTGASTGTIDQMLDLSRRTVTAGGTRALASLIKGWSKCMRSILSDNPYDTTTVGYCKLPHNCRHSFRKAGLTETEINLICARLGTKVGIPPFLFDPAYVRVLLPNPGISLVRRVNPFANIGRTAPVADSEKCNESIADFFKTTSRSWESTFDFSYITRCYATMCRGKIPRSTRWSTSRNSSYDYPRSKGGKLGEIQTELVGNFIYLTIDQLYPVRPDKDLYDILGNLALKSDDWAVGVPITDVMFPDLKSEFLDHRLGLFGLLWAIEDIRKRYPESIESDSIWFSIGHVPPTIRFFGSIHSRVESIPEEGFKARVITVPPLSVAILQIALRHILDPFVRRDNNIKIGLLSAVKLYDLMVSISGSRTGLDNDSDPSFFHRCCESVDLTTATDSPYRSGVCTIVRTFAETVLGDNLAGFTDFVLDLALSARIFEHRLKPSSWQHLCGIMMGEAMSGVYLNVMTGLVRTFVIQLKEYFDWYQGETSADADEFIRDHTDLIQEFLDSVVPTQFDPFSSQSGDDMIGFNEFSAGELRPFLVLFYRILGLTPSESTFYSSESFGTFTEESCYRDSTTLGWVFLDCLKPRLFNPEAKDNLQSVLSRIRQITSKLRYQAEDQELVERVSYCVDLIIQNNRIISDRVQRYNIVPAFPEFLGGLDHPSSLLEDVQFDIPDQDRQIAVFLRDCSEDILFEIKYHYISEDIDDTLAQDLRDTLRRAMELFRELPETKDGTPVPLMTMDAMKLLNRSDYMGWAEFYRDLNRVKKDEGLLSFDEILTTISNGFMLRAQLNEHEQGQTNPMIRLRNRREFLLKQVPQDVDPHDFMWSDLRTVQSRLSRLFQNRVTPVEDFLFVLGLDSLPILTCPINLSIGGVAR